MEKVNIQIPLELVKWVKNHEKGITDNQITEMLYDAVRKSEIVH